LLDLGRAVKLVVGIECCAAVLELDLRVHDDVVVELVRRRQYESRGVEAGLPATKGGRVLPRPKMGFAIGADSEAGEG
jgi:hypothetical protein